MQTTAIPHPRVASQVEWLEQRKRLLAREKELTREQDRLSADRRRLPMVKIEKEYVFEGPDGMKSLLDLFEGLPQLIVYHFMFDPEWEEGCMGCTGFVNALGDLSMLKERNTTFALISRAPWPKLAAYKAKQGWDRDWYSSYGSEFNYDFHVTLDPAVEPVEYNYRTAAEWEAAGLPPLGTGELHGLSVFFQVDGEVFHTYSAYARGLDRLTDSYDLLEVTPYGRQEDWEDSPEGWPQRPTYG